MSSSEVCALCLAPTLVEVAIDGQGIAPVGPLEHHVFEEVRHAGHVVASRRGSPP